MTDLLVIHDPSVGHSCSVLVFCVPSLETLPVILLLLAARITRLFAAAIGQCLKNELFHLKNLTFLSPDCWNRRRESRPRLGKYAPEQIEYATMAGNSVLDP